MVRNQSKFWYAYTTAATRATIAIMIQPIGLFSIAAFSSHWATVHAPVATRTASITPL